MTPPIRLQYSCMVRLLAETWIEIEPVHVRVCQGILFVSLWGCELKYVGDTFGRITRTFVSLRRRELKLLADNTDRSIKCSSPCGDVSWNDLATGGAVKTACSSPYGDVNWNIVAVKKKTCHSVRLLTETWVEILLQIKDLCATISSSPYGDVSWNM